MTDDIVNDMKLLKIAISHLFTHKGRLEHFTVECVLRCEGFNTYLVNRSMQPHNIKGIRTIPCASSGGSE